MTAKVVYGRIRDLELDTTRPCRFVCHESLIVASGLAFAAAERAVLLRFGFLRLILELSTHVFNAMYYYLSDFQRCIQRIFGDDV